MSQEFHGNVGQVAAGDINNFNISVGSNSFRPLCEWSAEELRTTLSHYQFQWWSGFRGYWLNVPCLIMLVLLLGVAGGLFAGILPIRDPQSIWMVVAPTLLLIVGLSFWLTHIRRIESRVMAESRAAIDAIRIELRKRR